MALQHDEVPRGYTPHKSNATMILDPDTRTTFSCDKCREIVAKVNLDAHICGAKSSKVGPVEFQDLDKHKRLCKVCYSVMTLGCVTDHSLTHNEETKERPRPSAQVEVMLNQMKKAPAKISSMIVDEGRLNDVPDKSILSLSESDESSDEDSIDLEKVEAERLKKEKQAKKIEAKAKEGQKIMQMSSSRTEAPVIASSAKPNLIAKRSGPPPSEAAKTEQLRTLMAKRSGPPPSSAARETKKAEPSLEALAQRESTGSPKLPLQTQSVSPLIPIPRASVLRDQPKALVSQIQRTPPVLDQPPQRPPGGRPHVSPSPVMADIQPPVEQPQQPPKRVVVKARQPPKATGSQKQSMQSGAQDLTSTSADLVSSPRLPQKRQRPEEVSETIRRFSRLNSILSRFWRFHVRQVERLKNHYFQRLRRMH